MSCFILSVPPNLGNKIKHGKHEHDFKICRNRKSVKLWELPEEVTLLLFRGLHVCDLLSLRSTNSYFRDLIDSNPSVWSHVSFSSSWPSIPNLRHFEKAANLGNTEALVKLGIAYLYNEGLPGDIQGKEITGNGEKAAQLFCQLEMLRKYHDAFTWIFIRPPWASCGACCKEFVFSIMKRQANLSGAAGIHVCVAKTLQLLEEEDWESDISYHLTQAAHSSIQAALMLWRKHCKYNINSWAGELSAMRELRYLVSRSQGSSNHMEASLELCHMYSQKCFGGISQGKAWSFVTNFLQSSKPIHIEKAFRPGLTPSMRFILLDWLVEVAGMKDFSSLTLHTAINIVDRYLKQQPTTRSQLQLLGVSAMVISSRFLGRDIITVREAAWLTDNTYKYGDVVQMLGEITAALHGNFRVITSLDYVILLGQLLSNDPRTQSLTEYICELSVLHASLGELPQAEVAAGACMLARMHTLKDSIWPPSIQIMSGFSLENVTKAALEVHKKCFVDFGLQDYRHVQLQAVKQRYEDERFHSVSAIQILQRNEVLSLLGVKEPIFNILPAFPKSALLLPAMDTQDIILSPSRHGHKRASGLCRLSAERENAATPTLEAMEANFDLNESVMSEVSGYEGDMDEDEEDSFFSWHDPDNREMSGFESLWSDDEEALPDEWRSELHSSSQEASSCSWTFSDNSNGVNSPVGLSVIPSLRVTPSTSDDSHQGQFADSDLHHSFILQGRSNSTGSSPDLNLSSHTPETGHTLRNNIHSAIHDNPNISLASISQPLPPFNFDAHDDMYNNRDNSSTSATSLSNMPQEVSSSAKVGHPGLRVVNPNIPSAPQVKRKSPSQDGNVSKKYVFSLP